MQNLQRTTALLVALILFILLPLAAVPLQQIVERAMVESPRMEDLELSKRSTLLSIALSKAEDRVGVSLDGEVGTTLDLDTPKGVISTSLTSQITLPNDGKTTISLGSGKVTYDTDKQTYSFGPSASVRHTITTGLTVDNRKNLTNRQNELLATSSYEASKLSFTSTLYTQIATLLEHERTVKRTTKEIADLKRTLEQNLSLRLIREESLTHRAAVQNITSRESSLAGAVRAQELALAQFESLAGFPWEGVSEIREPDLYFDRTLAEQNSNLEQKRLAVEIAREDFALEQAKHTNKSIILGGSLGYNQSKSDVPSLITGKDYSHVISGGGSVALAAKQFGLSANVAASYDFERKKFTPTVTIGGSWANNPSSSSELLQLQQKETAVLSGELALQSALDEFYQSSTSLESSITSYLTSGLLLLESIAYNEETLAQQRALYERGLASTQEITDAEFQVELDTYALQIHLLEGLRLENQIKSFGL